MTHNNIVDILHVGFIHIFLPQFLTDGLVNVLLLQVGHLCVSLGKLNTHARDHCWHPRVGEGIRCLGRDGWLADINVGCSNALLQLLHRPVELVQGYWSKIKHIAL